MYSKTAVLRCGLYQSMWATKTTVWFTVPLNVCIVKIFYFRKHYTQIIVNYISNFRFAKQEPYMLTIVDAVSGRFM